MTTTARPSSSLPPAALGAFRQRFHGEVVAPGDPAYDQHRRVWNGSVDRHPALVARCTSPADVAAALDLARSHDLVVAVRGGGHSFPGHSVCDDGMVVDLSPMKGIVVDPAAGTVRVQGGALLGELDRATEPYGAAVPAGIVTHTGVAGLTLGGGIGWLMRKYGLTIDNLVGADVVTADGTLVRADETHDSDLFWGLRGGGGNFGVVTEFEFRLCPVGAQVVAGPVFWPMEDTPGLLRFYRRWVAEAPDELMTIVLQRRAPDIPAVPRDLVGRHVVGVAVCHVGDVEEGERIVRPLKEYGAPLLDLCRPKPFVEHQSMFDPGFPHGWWYYVRACDVDALTDEVIDVMADFGRRIVSPISSVALWQMGGAMSRVPEDATAFGGRHAGYTFNINGNAYDGSGFEEERQWARDYWTALAPYHRGVYVNFLMDEGADRTRQAYGEAKLERLTALKTRYDPTNLFRLNQNIPPAGT